MRKRRRKAKNITESFMSVSKFKEQTNQPHLSDEEALYILESLRKFAQITFKVIANEKK